MKKFFTLISAAMLTILSVGAQEAEETVFSYASPDAATSMIGAGRYVNNDVAILINNPMYRGYEVVGISVDVPVKDGCSVDPVGYAWMTSELFVSPVGYINVPDIGDPEGVPGEIKNVGTEANPRYRLDITFPEPYVIPAEGVYVGYTLKVTSLASWTQKYPILTAASSNPEGGLFVHFDYAQGATTPPLAINKSWQDLSKSNQAVSTMRVILRGQSKSCSGQIVPAANAYGKAGSEIEISANFHNYGTVPVNTVEYTYSAEYAAGQAPAVSQNVINFPTPVQSGETVDLKLPFTMPEVNGDFPITLTTTLINGESNTYEEPEATFTLFSRPWIPKKRALIEDYTGLWCQYCPAAYVCLKQLSDDRADDFVALTYHRDDSMQTISSGNQPDPTAGEPALQFDRGATFPTSEYPMANAKLDQTIDMLAPADIDVNIFWTDATKSELLAEANVHFLDAADEDQYRLSFALVEDDMSDPSWKQRNAFLDPANYPGEWYKTKYWDLFMGKSLQVTGIVYDDVTLLYPDCHGIPGSVPAVNADQTFKQYARFKLSDAVCNYTGGSDEGKNIIKDKDKLRVVALIHDAATGKPLNVNTSGYSALASVASGVENLPAGSASEVINEEYYSLDGVRLQQCPDKGVVIIVRHYADGTLTTAKRLQ